MAMLRVNGIVPGRKPKRNPHTCSGFPQWNTFAPLGIETTAKNARRAMTGLLGKGGGGGRKNHKLDPGNLAHRMHYKRDLWRGWFERARRTSLKIDGAKGQALDKLLEQYTQDVHALRDAGARGLIDELIRRERARGVIRAVITVRQ